MKICIYASDLAVITGHNKYQDVSEIILKLWQRNFPEDYSNILNKVSESIQQFDRTQANLDELVLLSKSELIRAKPIISELTKASFHLNNILESLDNPETLKDIQELASTSSSLTKKIDQMSSDMGNIMEDKELINALKRVTIGLSKLFDDIYP